MRMIERWFPCQEVSDASAAGWGTGNAEAKHLHLVRQTPACAGQSRGHHQPAAVARRSR